MTYKTLKTTYKFYIISGSCFLNQLLQKRKYVLHAWQKYRKGGSVKLADPNQLADFGQIELIELARADFSFSNHFHFKLFSRLIRGKKEKRMG